MTPTPDLFEIQERIRELGATNYRASAIVQRLGLENWPAVDAEYVRSVLRTSGLARTARTEYGICYEDGQDIEIQPASIKMYRRTITEWEEV